MIIWLIAFSLLCFGGFLSILFLALYGWVRVMHSPRYQMEQARLRTERLRAERLYYDRQVVIHRAEKLANDVVLGDLNIEIKKKLVETLGGYAGPPRRAEDDPPGQW